MMLLSMVVAMLYGPWQLWVLASPTRTIQFRTVSLGVLAGVAVAFPVSVGIEWAWVAAAGSWWNGYTFELVDWAGWTVDPFIEEVVRLLPLVLVMLAVAKARQQWAVTDLVVLGFGVGSGYRLAEHVARFGEEVRGPFAQVSNDSGWVIGLAGFRGTTLVPYPWVWLRQWIPEGVQIDSFGADQVMIGTHNLIAIWGTFGGLAVGLWVLSKRDGGFWSPVLVRVVAVTLVGFAGLAHAQINADLQREDWPVPALDLPRVLEPFYWAWPLVVLVVAMVIDGRVARRRWADPVMARLRIEPGRSDVWSLFRLSWQRPWVSAAAVWSFVTTRRALVYSLASEKNGAGQLDSGPARLFERLEPVAFRFRQQLRGEGDLWTEVAAARTVARQARRSVLLRSPRGWAAGGLSVVLFLVPLAYFVAGTHRGGHRIQEWMSEGGGSGLVVVAAVAGIAVGIVLVVLHVRALGRERVVVAELEARSVLAIAIKLGAIGSMAFGLFQVWSGAALDSTVHSAQLHGLDALGSLLWSAGINLGLLAVTATVPVVGLPLLLEHHRFKAPWELAQLLPWPFRLLVLIGGGVVMAEGRAVPGEWDDGPPPPPPLDSELDQIIDHAWEKHVLGQDGGRRSFPEVEAKDELKEIMEEAIENATEWGYRDDGSVYWYDEVTDTVVIKNPPGVGGTTYRPGED